MPGDLRTLYTELNARYWQGQLPPAIRPEAEDDGDSVIVSGVLAPS
jgi:hypothetical protein